MGYQISLTTSAKEDIAYFHIHDQRIIVAGIIAHLTVDAEVKTRKRKLLRSNPIAPWALRIDNFRVFYSVEDGNNVNIIAVGQKVHNDLFIRGEKAVL